MNIINKSIRYFLTIINHKAAVFYACMKAGLYLQAFTHDLSKFTLAEFIEYAKYYNGEISPVDKAKSIKGYCFSWLHHRGRNPHHYEYWIDNLDNGGIPLIIPFKYAMEMICDYIGAGKVYEKENWTFQSPLKYWNRKKETAKIHPALMDFFTEIFELFSETGYKALKRIDAEWQYDDIIYRWRRANL